jgi:hypothetical protein
MTLNLSALSGFGSSGYINAADESGPPLKSICSIDTAPALGVIVTAPAFPANITPAAASSSFVFTIVRYP